MGRMIELAAPHGAMMGCAPVMEEGYVPMLRGRIVLATLTADPLAGHPGVEALIGRDVALVAADAAETLCARGLLVVEARGEAPRVGVGERTPARVPSKPTVIHVLDDGEMVDERGDGWGSILRAFGFGDDEGPHAVALAGLDADVASRHPIVVALREALGQGPVEWCATIRPVKPRLDLDRDRLVRFLVSLVANCGLRALRSVGRDDTSTDVAASHLAWPEGRPAAAAGVR